MAEWFIFAVVAMIASGVQNFGYKLAAEKGCNSATLLSSFLGVTITLAFVALVFTRATSVNSLNLFLLFAVFNALAFGVTFLARQEAFKLIPLVIGLPITKMSAALAAVIGVVLLQESLSVPNAIGILLSLFVGWILMKKDDGDSIRNFKKGILLIFIALIASSAGKLAIKLGASEGSNFLFMVTTYGMMFFPTVLLQKRFNSVEDATRRTTLKWGIVIGSINFVGFSALLAALQIGPMSLIFPIKTLGVAISVAMSIGILKEELNSRRMLGIILALAALILLRF